MTGKAATMIKRSATLVRPDGNAVKLGAVGLPLVVFFYPKADTPGCTTEAKDFSDALPQFDRLGVQVVGISKDAPAKLERFADKHGLRVPLLSDAEGSLIEDMGVWVEKQLYGRSYMGIDRSTFLFDAKGRLVRDWRKVKVKGHAQAVLQAATAMAAGEDVANGG